MGTFPGHQWERQLAIRGEILVATDTGPGGLLYVDAGVSVMHPAPALILALQPCSQSNPCRGVSPGVEISGALAGRSAPTVFVHHAERPDRGCSLGSSRAREETVPGRREQVQVGSTGAPWKLAGDPSCKDQVLSTCFVDSRFRTVSTRPPEGKFWSRILYSLGLRRLSRRAPRGVVV